jgi:hypothetical protein
MDFSDALGAIQGWIGVAVSVSCTAHGTEYLRATGVLDRPELHGDGPGGGEHWIFPLTGNTGSFALQQRAYVGAAWSEDRISLQIELTAASLQIELA